MEIRSSEILGEQLSGWLSDSLAKSTYVDGLHNQAYQKNGIYYFGDYLNSGTYSNDMLSIIATNLWSVQDAKLLLSEVTESTNPNG